MGVVATRISVSTATETKNRRHRTARYAIAVALMLMCLAALVLVPSFVPGAPFGWRSSTISIHDLKALRIQRRPQDHIPKSGDTVRIRGKLQGEYVPSLGMKSVDLTDVEVTITGRARVPNAERRAIVSLFNNST